MKCAVFTLFLLAFSGSVASADDAKPKAAITPQDAKEILTLLQSAQVSGASVPEAYRLMALLSQIANPPPQK